MSYLLLLHRVKRAITFGFSDSFVCFTKVAIYFNKTGFGFGYSSHAKLFA